MKRRKRTQKWTFNTIPEPKTQENKRKQGKLLPMNWHGREFMVNSEYGYYPHFQKVLSERINKKKATNCVLTSEGGSGKTYLGMDICRTIDPTFSIDQVVFTYVDFMHQLILLKMGKPILFDEPSYAMGKREWYKQLNQALVKTIESFRFKVHPLFIPIINKALLDKSIRNYLLQYHIVLRDRGKAVVYSIEPSQFQEKTYQKRFCELEYALFDNHLCENPSCLDCKFVEHPEFKCQVFRAKYERKKAETQDERYERTLEEAERKEARELTLQQIEMKLTPYLDTILKQGKKGDMVVDMSKLLPILERKLEVKLPLSKRYDLKALIEWDYKNNPDLFKV